MDKSKFEKLVTRLAEVGVLESKEVEQFIEKEQKPKPPTKEELAEENRRQLISWAAAQYNRHVYEQIQSGRLVDRSQILKAFASIRDE